MLKVPEAGLMRLARPFRQALSGSSEISPVRQRIGGKEAIAQRLIFNP